MSNPSGRIGSEWETRLVEYLRGRFSTVERLTKTGAKDEGDLWFSHAGVVYVVEAKATKAITLSDFVEQANIEAGHFAAKRKLPFVPPGVAIIKRRNHNVDKAYVAMDLATFIKVVKA